MTKEEIIARLKNIHSGGREVAEELCNLVDAVLDIASQGANVQSDWNQDDNTKSDYIKNKPTVPEEPIVVPTLGPMTELQGGDYDAYITARMTESFDDAYQAYQVGRPVVIDDSEFGGYYTAVCTGIFNNPEGIGEKNALVFFTSDGKRCAFIPDAFWG